MADILDHAIGWEVPLLPIHDGFVCREEDYPRLSKVMSYAFERRYGVKPKINLVAGDSGNKELLSI